MSKRTTVDGSAKPRPLSLHSHSKLVDPPVPAIGGLDIEWGAKRIAAFLNCGVDFVYGLARDPETPVRKLRGQVYASRAELTAYLFPTGRDETQNPRN